VKIMWPSSRLDFKVTKMLEAKLQWLTSYFVQR